MATTPSLPPVVCGTFAAAINQETVQKLFSALAFAMNNKVQHVHLLFQTSGGFVADGIALYNYFRTLPIDLTLYNSGTIASIGVVAYLGAKARKASKYSTFVIHRTQRSPTPATANMLKSSAESAALDDKRTEAILREHLHLPAEKWDDFNHYDLNFTAEEAVKTGITQEIAEFAPPAGTQVFNIA